MNKKGAQGFLGLLLGFPRRLSPCDVGIRQTGFLERSSPISGDRSDRCRRAGRFLCPGFEDSKEGRLKIEG